MKFTFKPSPNYRDAQSTNGIMRDLTIGLLVVFAFSLFYYATGENLGASYALRACGLLATAVISALVTEAIYFAIAKQPIVKSIKNSFGWVTAIILTLMCPINISYYALAVSTILAIIFGKLVFGGFGQNIFNPAALGRAIIMASFAGSVAADFATSATPTASFAAGGWLMSNETFNSFIAQFGGLGELFIGRYPGAMGETSALVILLVGAFLAYRKVIDWKVPVAYLGTILVATLGIALVNGQGMWYPLFHLLTGGVMFGAIFMLTDPVTNPTSSAGRVMFGIGAAFFTLLIRIKGNLPEGVLYSILLMNMLTPLIERITTGNQIKIAKKNLRNVLIVLIGCLAIILGVSTTLEAKEISINAPVEDIEGIEGVAKGFGGDVKVTVATDASGNITKIVATGDAETPGLGLEVINKFNSEGAAKFEGVALADADFDSVDMVSGSTITSKALVEALKQTQGGNAGTGAAVEETSAPAEEIEGIEGVAKGFGGDVKVTVATDDAGIITKIVASGDAETPGLGLAVIDQFNSEDFAQFEGIALTEADFDSLDMVTGSTVTSKAIIEALKQTQGGSVEAPQETAASAAGTEVEGVAKGYGGDVVVTIVLDEAGNITSVTAVGENETAGLGLDAIEKFNSEDFKNFEGQLLADVDFSSIDVVTGSTMTSNAVIEAATAAQEMAAQQ
ncbi:MAG: RnfABCDGE type electron transport complex subunit D [Erysipelotrichaceae bacterium]|nr:RnfABCDGE type electron transport complex subunit D [Erysipelotrichaceae bacterium]